MTKKISIFIVFLLLNTFLYAQCSVTKLDVGNKMIRYSMTEKFYENEDLENGLKSIYISTNFFGDKSKAETPFILEIVVTYFWTDYQKEMTPNKLYIENSKGENITLMAEEKSLNTVNKIAKAPANIKSIECSYKLSKSELNLITSTHQLSKLIVYDYKNNISIDLSKTYSGQIPEMLYCVIKP